MAVRLGGACRAARVDAGIKQLDVALEAGVAESTISKFEAGTGGWTQADRIVSAYAHLLDTTPETLWRQALTRR